MATGCHTLSSSCSSIPKVPDITPLPSPCLRLSHSAPCGYKLAGKCLLFWVACAELHNGILLLKKRINIERQLTHSLGRKTSCYQTNVAPLPPSQAGLTLGRRAPGLRSFPGSPPPRSDPLDVSFSLKSCASAECCRKSCSKNTKCFAADKQKLLRGM